MELASAGRPGRRRISDYVLTKRRRNYGVGRGFEGGRIKINKEGIKMEGRREGEPI